LCLERVEVHGWVFNVGRGGTMKRYLIVGDGYLVRLKQKRFNGPPYTVNPIRFDVLRGATVRCIRSEEELDEMVS
jgi:hypothetical protein